MIEVKDDWANAIYSNGQYALLLSTDTINDGNVHLPFKVKAYMPAGVDYRLREGELYVVDRNGNLRGGAGTPFKAYLNGNHSDNWHILHLQVTTDFTFDFEFNPSAPGAEFYDNASMYILMGNIAKRIPINLTVP
jgi:hypothetical protein